MSSPALRGLLRGLIDYAGLFPPAGLAMDAVVRNYDSYRNGEHAWMLGRLIVPAGRLEEYAEAVRNAGIDASTWSLSVLATADDAAAIARFNTEIGRAGADESSASGSGSIDVLEIKAANTREIQDAAQAFGRNYQLYFETPPEKWPSLLPATAVAKGRAKIRTGGEVASAIPEESRVLEFLRIAIPLVVLIPYTSGSSSLPAQVPCTCELNLNGRITRATSPSPRCSASAMISSERISA